MTVEDPSVIDQVSMNHDATECTLDMVEIRSFGLVSEQLGQITDKINAYLRIIQSGEVYEHVPQAQGKQIKVQFVCIDEPTKDPRLMDLLGAASALFAKQGAGFGVQVMSPEFAGLTPGWDAERAALRERLRQAGVPDDLYEIEGVNKARRELESYYFLAGRPGKCTVGVYERGEERVGMRFESDAAACGWLRDELVCPAPTVALSERDERDATARTAAFSAEVAELIRRATHPGSVLAVPYLLGEGLVLDQFGQESGSYLYPDGTPFQERSLPPSVLNTTDPRFPHGYHRYRVIRPFHVRAGFTAPAFEQPGGGLQFRIDPEHLEERPPLPTILWLLHNGYVQRIQARTT